jgi:hypothetical protein
VSCVWRVVSNTFGIARQAAARVIVWSILEANTSVGDVAQVSATDTRMWGGRRRGRGRRHRVGGGTRGGWCLSGRGRCGRRRRGRRGRIARESAAADSATVAVVHDGGDVFTIARVSARGHWRARSGGLCHTVARVLAGMLACETNVAVRAGALRVLQALACGRRVDPYRELVEHHIRLDISVEVAHAVLWWLGRCFRRR